MAGKHTLRRNVNNGRSDMPYSMKIENVDRFSMAHEDGSVEVALSTIDSLLAKHGVFAAENAHSNGNLNKQGLWDSLLEELEITCLRKEERMNVAQNSYETVYTVPVTGHQLLLPMIEEDRHLGSYNVLQEKDTNKVSQKAERLNKSMMKKIKLNPQQYMFWEGKYYDTNVVYDQTNGTNTLKPVGFIAAPIQKLAGASGIIEFLKGVQFQNSHHRREYRCNIGHLDAHHPIGRQWGQSPGGWEQKSTEDYLQINLSYPRYVTHIGTAGAFPQTTVFPIRKSVCGSRRRYCATHREDTANLLTKNGNGVQRNKFASYINILKEDEFSLAWVTTYEVHYRHTVTNKWTLLCVTSANSDAFSEQVLDLRPYFNAKDGLLAQYLRIRPLEYHIRPKIRISVYGVDPRRKEEMSTSLLDNATITTTVRRLREHAHTYPDTDSDISCTADDELEEGADGAAKEQRTGNKKQPAIVPEISTVPTITYTVLHGMTPRNRLYVRDSYFHTYKDDWYLRDSSKHPKFQKKCFYAAHIKEEYDSLLEGDPYDSDEFIHSYYDL